MGSTELASPCYLTDVHFVSMPSVCHVFTSVNNHTFAAPVLSNKHICLYNRTWTDESRLSSATIPGLKLLILHGNRGRKKASLPSNKQSVKPIFRTVILPLKKHLVKPDNKHLLLLVTTSQQQWAILDCPDWRLVRPEPPWLTDGPPASCVRAKTELLVALGF